MRAVTLAVWAIVLAVPAAEGASQVKVKGKVEAVTLYRGQALVVRVVPFEAPAGAVQLTVTDLPESVLPASLFAGADKGVQVRAVRYRAQALGKAPKEEVRQLDEQIADLERAIRANAHQQELARKQGRYLDNLETFVAPTAKTEMSKGVLNADTLRQVTEMMFERREQIAERTFELAEEARKLRERLSLLQRKRAELTRSHSKTVHEALVFLDKAADGQSEIRLNYLVSNATWEPTYNLRTDGDMTKVSVEYAALARQMSGEDWEDVELTLSTAGARMVADGPNLAPLWVTLTQSRAAYNAPQIEQQLKKSRGRLRSARQDQQVTVDYGGNIEQQWEMNRAAWESQGLELAADPKDIHLIRRAADVQARGLSATYKLKGKVTFASRRESQMLEIDRLTLPATFYHEAVPLLAEYVYRYAQLSNTSKLSLLQGRSNVYLNGEFVGAGNVPMVARGQKVTVGFGIDPQLRARREFVAKEESKEFFGGDQLITYRYRLVLDNYSDKPVSVRLLDRIPMEKDDLKVTLRNMTDPLSKDKDYLRSARPRGILRWDITVPAKAAATTAKILEYSFRLAFDKDLHISTQPPRKEVEAAVKEQFFEAMH